MSQDPYGNIWAKMYQLIRRANVFIDNVDKTYNMTQEDKTWWKADMKALKAYIYFELLRTYGPICLIPQNMPVDLEMEDYQLPRQPVDTCFKEIIRLLDEAEPDIPRHSQRSAIYGFTFTKEALYALKARVLVYAASPLFNGNIFYADFKNKNPGVSDFALLLEILCKDVPGKRGGYRMRHPFRQEAASHLQQSLPAVP